MYVLIWLQREFQEKLCWKVKQKEDKSFFFSKSMLTSSSATPSSSGLRPLYRETSYEAMSNKYNQKVCW